MDFHLYSTGKYYNTHPKFYHAAQLPAHGYASLYGVSESTAKAIEQEGTAKGFKGIVWSERLWLDFDSYGAADRAQSRLEEMGYDFIEYDSGGRGAHFGILRASVGSHLLPARDKAWAKNQFPEADLSIYTHLHLFRLPGTIHERTGRRKELVCEHRGSTLELPKLKWEELPISQISGTGKSVFDCPRVMANSVPLRSGEARHPNLIRLLYALRDDAKVDVAAALFWVTEVNKLWEEPKSMEDLEKAVRSVYEG